MTDDGIDKFFWGVVMRPEKRYEQTVEVGFHLSKAVLDPNTAKNGWTTVTVENDGEEIIICALNDKTLSTDLDLNFMEGETVCFQVNGAGTVHMSGYLMSGEDDSMMDFEASSEDESESEEVPALVNGDISKKKRKMLEDSLTEASGEKKKAKLTPLDKALAKKEKEEAVKNAKEASKNLKKEVKKAEKKKEEEDDDESEDDDDDDDDEEEGDDEDDSGDDDEEDDDSDDDDEEEDEEEEASSSKDVSMNSTADSTPKKQEKNKKKNQQNGGTPATSEKKKKENDENVTPNKKAKDEQTSPKKTPKNEKNKKDGGNPAKTPTRTVKGGIKIQDMVEGTGPVAGHKKTVGMFYEGRLAKNGKKFDGNFGGKPFKFKLGMGEVIKGWDIGVDGMKVGGKRRLQIPAKMGYGSNGAPPTIPPNADLVFDVECKFVS